MEPRRRRAARSRGHSAGRRRPPPREQDRAAHEPREERDERRAPEESERKLQELLGTLRETDGGAWAGGELRDEVLMLRSRQRGRHRSPRRRSPERGGDGVAAREADHQAARRVRSARDALARTAAEEELAVERVRRQAAEQRADMLAKELEQLRGQLVLAENRRKGTFAMPTSVLELESRGVEQMSGEIAALQEALTCARPARSSPRVHAQALTPPAASQEHAERLRCCDVRDGRGVLARVRAGGRDPPAERGADGRHRADGARDAGP